MKTILNILEQYLSESTVEGSLMIYGQWGCGKTYFWKNIYVPRAKEKDKSFIPVYISLYGLTVEQAKKRLALEILRGFSGVFTRKYLPAKINKLFEYIQNHGVFKKSGEVAKSVAVQLIERFREMDAATCEIAFETLKYREKPAVICLDDLERAKEDVSEYLGLIGNLTENICVPVVLLCNEEEITNRDDKYLKTHEKAIGRKINYSISMSDIIINIIDSSKAMLNGKEWLKVNIAIINDIIESIDKRNIRIVKKSLGYFLNYVYPIWHELPNIKKSEEQLRDYLRFILSCFIEMESYGVSKNDFKKISNIISEAWMYQMLTRDNEKGKQEREESYREKYIRKYYSKSPLLGFDRIVWSDAIYRFATDGIMDSELLKTELTLPEEKKPLEKSLDVVLNANCDYCTNEEFECHINRIYRALKDETPLNAIVFIRIINCFMLFVEHGGINIDERELKAIIERRIPNIVEQTNEDVDLDDIVFLLKIQNDYVKKCADRIKKHIKEKKERKKIEHKQQLLLMMGKNPNEYIESFGSNNGIYRYECIGDEKDALMIYEWMLKAKNKDLRNFQALIRSRYILVSNAKEFLSPDKLYLETLGREIDKNIPKQTPGLSTFLMSCIAKTIKESIEKIT